MSKFANIEKRVRVVDPYPLLALCQDTEDVIHISPRRKGVKKILKGIPGRDLDIVVADDVANPEHPKAKLVLELVRKTGKFDGRVRDRLFLRRMPEQQARDFELAEIVLDVDDKYVTIGIGDWKRSYKRYRYLLDGDYGNSLGRILKWNWRRFFTHLTNEDEIHALSETWGAEVESHRKDWTLNEFNRSASRRLYHFSKESGWVKLDARQRAKLHANSMWVTSAWYADAMAAWKGHPTGESEATLNAAERGSWESYEELY